MFSFLWVESLTRSLQTLQFVLTGRSVATFSVTIAGVYDNNPEMVRKQFQVIGRLIEMIIFKDLSQTIRRLEQFQDGCFHYPQFILE